MKNSRFHLLLAGCLALTTITSCVKDDAPATDNTLRITPELIASYINKDWNTVAPTWETKDGYQYAGFPAGGDISASITAPAIDDSTTGLHYNVQLLLNADKKINQISFYCRDTLSIANGNKLFLYYHRHFFKNISNITFQQATYNKAQSPQITTNELLTRVNALTCTHPFLNLRNAAMDAVERFSSGTGYPNDDRGFFSVSIVAY